MKGKQREIRIEGLEVIDFKLCRRKSLELESISNSIKHRFIRRYGEKQAEKELIKFLCERLRCFEKIDSWS